MCSTTRSDTISIKEQGLAPGPFRRGKALLLAGADVVPQLQSVERCDKTDLAQEGGDIAGMSPVLNCDVKRKGATRHGKSYSGSRAHRAAER
jgi:hypothetical protein